MKFRIANKHLSKNIYFFKYTFLEIFNIYLEIMINFTNTIHDFSKIFRLPYYTLI